MIEAKRLQRSFGDGLIAEEIEDLRETWMRHVDVVLQDEMLLSAVHQALSSRYPNSRRYGRPGYPAEVVLRLLILKHIRNWSYASWNGKSGPTWCIATSPASVPARCPMPRPWAAGRRARTRRHQGDPRSDRADRAGAEGGAGAQDACRHHGGREQYPLSD